MKGATHPHAEDPSPRAGTPADHRITGVPVSVGPLGAKLEPAAGLLLTLHRGIQVLEQVARDRGRATAKSLGAELGINLGTCYQLLRTLQANGYVHRMPGGRYGLGAKVAMLADQYESSVLPPPTILDLLHGLHQDLGETVYLAVRRSKDIPIVEVLEGTNLLRVGNLAPGYSDHPNIRSSAKAVLAHVGLDDLPAYVEDHTFPPITARTITTRDALVEELAATRARGYAVDNEEYTQGVACLAAVIVDEAGQPYGAYASSFPAARLEVDRDPIAARLLTAGGDASRALGYTGPYPPHQEPTT